MSSQLRIYHRLLPYALIPICLLVMTSYGKIGYATLIEKSGFYGSLYRYYQLSREQFCVYNFLICGIAAIMLVFQAKYFIDGKSIFLIKLFRTFIAFVVLIVTCEAYLSIRYVGKG